MFHYLYYRLNLNYYLLQRLERNKEALEDADNALKKNKSNIKAIDAKAEALFSSGQFEQALVHFEQGKRMYNDFNMTNGILKSQHAIISCIGEDGIVFNEEMVRTAIREIQRVKERREQRKKEKSNEWKTLKKKKEKIKCKPKPPIDPALNFSNLLLEEEQFLQRLKCLEKLNYRMDVKRGSKTPQV